MNLSSKIALSIWTAIVIAGFIVGLVFAIPAQVDWELGCLIMTGLGLLAIVGLCLAVVTTLAWCGIEDEKE